MRGLVATVQVYPRLVTAEPRQSERAFKNDRGAPPAGGPGPYDGAIGCLSAIPGAP
jgi:hypothetical protein